MPTLADAPQPATFQTVAADGYRLGGLHWRHPNPARREIVVIVPATAVACRYYSRFASFIASTGRDVALFDYRGIGLSRPATLRGFQADWVDWGEKDVEAILGYLATRDPEAPIDAVAHSIGGLTAGLAPGGQRLRRMVTVAAQHAYWRDYHRDHRLAMLLKWHVAMPLLTAMFGYFPGQRLGWLEDTPAGIVRDWTRMGPELTASLRRGRFRNGLAEGEILASRLAALSVPILALAFTDDPFGTPPAIDRLLASFPACPVQRRTIAPEDIGVAAIGHFGFFHSRFRETLWPLVLPFLNDGPQD